MKKSSSQQHIAMTEEKQKRTVFAPQPAIVSSAKLPANHVISVELGDEEDVEWIWMSLPDGKQYVTGYTIVQKQTD